MNNVDQFESYVFNQKEVTDDSYDKDYFVGDWREGTEKYSIEERRKIEGKNPENIKEFFNPKKALDFGCGPGALMCFLDELGVDVYGVDHSEAAKSIAPDNIRDKIMIGSVSGDLDFDQKFDLVICRELLEHLTVLQVKKAVANMAKLSSKYVYVTTRFHPEPESLLDVTTDFETDSTHITVLNKEFLRVLFVLEGMKRRPDLEQKLDWKNYGRVLVYEKVNN
jgi:2-polyprenyl-3-methyl-5-hydroxy-6-metoxy-1,4-benzoquinol methylase